MASGVWALPPGKASGDRVCAHVCACGGVGHLPVSQRQFHKALAAAQGDGILARPGAQGLGRAPHDDDDGVASPIL